MKSAQDLFAEGFDLGERQAYRDRRSLMEMRRRPANASGPYADGYWQGYLSRNPMWALRNTPVKPYSETEA